MKVVKTVKLYIGGQFVRTESGRSYSFNKPGTENQYMRLCQASRKDFRNAVEICRNSVSSWSSRSAYNRSQILYRMAEMCEGKRLEFSTIFKDCLDVTNDRAEKMVDEAIDSFVYYAGFCDKYQQISGSVNPVNGPFHNFTTPEPVGMTALIDSDEFNFGSLIDNICSILVGGNAMVVLLGSGCPAILAPLAEIFATSDLPSGVINLLTGHLDELKQFIATHREVRSVSFQNEREDVFFDMKEASIDNMKRMVPRHKNVKSLDNILNFVEYKTVWHPIGY
ncbi:MAG: aldehyde dehydrogenase family protein [Bacteriovoracaceae bacterium]|jgi:acyl-CoA reductase-like NAD-dependent aldehyde dehydrogenase|nr:aldehyde dehydrogenase family protein [Bacteriovoracaceae bacterium]